MDIRNKIGPEEQIRGLDAATVGDFWSWAYSDLLSNTIRPLFAEYLVGRCLAVIDRPRIEWDHVDFVYQGKKIEVKSAGYVQTWNQKALSVIAFDISPQAKPWIAETNTYGPPSRSADCYVLCVHTDCDRSSCIVNDISRWEFYVLSACAIAESFSAQQRVRLSRIQKLCLPVKYRELRQTIDAVLGIDKPPADAATA